MSSQRKMYNKLPQAQRGVTTMLAVLMMLSLFTFLAVVTDTGRLYLEKRSLQKNADLAAMETALLYCRDQTLDVEAMTLEDMYVLSAQRNNFLGNDTNSTVAVTRNGNAITVALSYRVPASLFEQLLPSDDNEINLTASATAKACEPTAQLAIKSSIASINDGVLLGLLGIEGGIGVGADNLINVNLNLLSYLDALASELSISVGDYDTVLNADITLLQLLNVAASILDSEGSTLASTTINGIVAQIPGGIPAINLGDILSIADDANKAALDASINALSLVQGAIQLAAGDNVATIDLPVVGIPGIANVSAKVSVIEPAHISAIGNPDRDHIHVNTAQLRTLISIDLGGGSNIVSDLTDAVSPLLSPIITFLDTAGFGGLNLLEDLGNLLTSVFEAILTVCTNNCSPRNAIYAEGLSQPLQISIDAGRAAADIDPNAVAPPPYVCSEGKELNVTAETGLVTIEIGRIDEVDAFSSVDIPSVDPVSIIEIGYRKIRPRTCFKILGIGSCEDEQWEQSDGSWLTNGKSSAKRYVIAGLGLKFDSTVAGHSSQLLPPYESPDLPEVGEDPFYQAVPNGIDLVNAINVEIVPYQGSEGGNLGAVLGGTLSLLDGVVEELVEVIAGENGVITNLLNPVVNTLLTSLGVDLAGADVGAALTCENDKVRLTN